MSGDKRTLRWCAKHEEPAFVYSDGSVACWYDSIVESNDYHLIVSLPQDDEIERLRAEVKRLQVALVTAWQGTADGLYDLLCGKEVRRD